MNDSTNSRKEWTRHPIRGIIIGLSWSMLAWGLLALSVAFFLNSLN
jgi:hypothetical protein